MTHIPLTNFAATTDQNLRWPLIDALRGCAIVAMIAFHFTWDLHFFGLIDYDIAFAPEGRLAAHLIAGTFLALVGAGLILASRNGLQLNVFLKRFGIIAGAAAIVSLGTAYMMPDEWIFFGVLHCIALSSLLALPLLQAPALALACLAAASLALPLLAAHPLLDAPALWWLGLNRVLPRTNDYVPLFPWFGVVLSGMAATRFALRHAVIAHALSQSLASRTARVLARLGRYSLRIYLVHQPLLMAALWLAIALFDWQSGIPREAAAFGRACRASCQAGGYAANGCAQSCDCIGKALEGSDLMSKREGDALSDAETKRLGEAIAQCRITTAP